MYIVEAHQYLRPFPTFVSTGKHHVKHKVLTFFFQSAEAEKTWPLTTEATRKYNSPLAIARYNHLFPQELDIDGEKFRDRIGGTTDVGTVFN